ncbi:centrosome-associated protein 350-like [Saccostrea cucullata]|uniref:centrosome-associated protein 350-like n=1 Tax=Saccostrea cuccullata TaxID=36930 RepID=UPI002ED2C657
MSDVRRKWNENSCDMLRGRKVTNPSVSAGGGSNRHDSNKDFNRAWSNIHKVKTELRKIEHRLGESEHRTVLNEIYETSITDYSPRTDLNVTYDATEAGRAAFVDRYGWTSNARNKPYHSSRKVVRIEDRYQEMDGIGARSRTEKNDGKGTTHGKPGKSGPETMANGGRDRKYKASEQPRDTGPMYSENPGEMYGDLIGATGVTNDLGSLDRDPSDINQDTLTDSRAIRETDIRFLNNDLSSYNDVRWGRPVNSSNQNHLAHVSVTVPRARNSYQHEPYPVRATHSNETERERKWEVGSTDSAASDTSSQIGRKLKKTLKDLDFDALSKIKEKIRKQQQRSASPKVDNLDRNGDDDEMGEADMNPMNGPHHYHHNEYEPVLSRASYDLPPPDGADSQRRVRKVAPAPTVPTYKGFSEAEVRYKYADFKPPKVMDWRKREKKKKAALKLQEKKMEQATKESVPEETKPKKKMTRIVATSNKKPEKQSKKDIITTSSWRAGQELILRELGPAKTRRTSQTSEASVDIRPPATGASNNDNEKDKREEVAEPKTATTVELERAKALSEEARKVLSDLNMGSENEEDDKPGKENEDNIKRRRSAKRKASKTTEPEKQSNAKQRHYDQEEVRRFIQKQKADRLRQQREEEKRKQRAQEMRSQQLEELRSKQKQSAHSSKRPTKSAGARSKGKAHDETFTHAPMSYMELPRHHPFHEDLQSGSMATTESERERHAGIPPREEEMEMSDDSSTLTGESLEAVTPTITPRVEFEDAKSKPKSDAHERNSVQDGNLNSANVKNLGGLTFNVDGVLSKFSEALHSRGNDINSGYGGSGSSTGSQDRPHVYGSEDPGSGRSKADRIQAIMNTAATLQQKIQAETSKFTGDNHELYKKRALPQSNEEEDFVLTRYERLTGAQQDFSVFSSNLPGQQRITRDSGPTDENPVETAAIRIQAAYRGHTVRQSMNWKLPSGNSVKTSHRKELHEEDDTISETDTISVTVTEESEEDSLTHRKVGTGLKQREFHAGSRSRPPAEEFVIPRPSHPSQPNRYSWESPSPDPYNVLSIFARKQKNQAGRPRSSASEVQVQQQRTSVKEDFRADPTHSQHSIVYKSTKVTSNLRTQSPSGAHNSTGVKGQSAAGSIRSETSHPVSGSQRNVYKSRSDATHPKVSGYSATTAESHDSDEDTIEGESYSQSLESDEEKHSGKVSKRVSEKSSIKSGYRPLGSKPTSLGPDGELSNEEESQSMSLDRVSPPGEESESRQFPPRLSPNSLERKFYLELNQLESMEESMRQLTGMERTRAVSMAQQETVSLAQMLKARQQAHEKDMKLLEGKAQQEAMEATSELQNARLRGSAASDGAEEILSRLSSHRTSARPIESSDNIRPRKAGKQSVSHAPESARTATQSYTRPTTYSDTSTRTQSADENVRTASDSQRGADSDSSIRSLSKAEGKDDSLKEDSISEELEDYTLDETMTEDEMDRSFRSILPSESHRKRAKKQLDNVSVTSDEGSGSAPATPRYSMDDLGSFIGEDSFNKFTEEMVKQFMREEELRAQHQASLLQLREKALMEKTKAELSWLEQQKQRIRNKGADDTFPQIIKKQRGLKMRLQEQQAEIKRLQEQNKAASRERQLILQQHEEISRMRQQTEKTKNKMGGRLSRPSEVHTEDEVSAFDDHSDAGTRTHPKKDYKSDSEIYTEPKSINKKGKGDSKTMEKMKKIHLDEKYLTVREHRLHDRRKNVEDLLKWKKRLDEEEEKIYKMEQTALKIWDGDKKEVKAKGGEAAQKEKPKTAGRKDKKESQTYSSVQDDSFVSEAITTAKDDSIKKSVTETPKTETVISEESSPEVKRVSSEQGAKYKTSLGRSASESSIPEEVLSQSSVEETPVTPTRRVKSSVAESTALNDSYGDNTFVDESTMATSRDKLSRKSPRSPLDQLSKQKINIPLAGRDLKPRRHGNRGRSSESESEESISHTDVSTYTETQSDLSDFEGRVRALTEDLKRRKIQADKLKKERKKRRKDILKNKEEALKKQIEALDNQIDQLKSEIHNTTDREPAKVKPQILKPRVSPVKKSPEVTSPKVVNTDDSSTESTHSSPSVVEDKDSKPSSPVSKSTPVSSRIPASLDRISEGSESSRSRSLRNKEDSSVTEDIETAADDSSVSGYVKIPKSPVSEKQPTYKEDDSYSMDFEKTASLAGPPSEKPPVSARSTEISLSKPAFNEQISEAISAVCSEHIDDSVRTESFVKPLDLKKDQEEPYSPRSSVTVSRPSSGKSERSYGSRSTDFESASESEPTSVAPSEQPEQQMKEESVIDSIIDIAQNTEDESEQYPVFNTTTKAQEEEDETPINSPRESSDFSQIDDVMADFNIGDYVSVTTSDRNRRKGQLLFKGKVHFAPGIWAGVELEKPDGKTDGMEDGKRYFSCKPGHGIFVPGNDLMPPPTPTPRSMGQGSANSITDESEEESEVAGEPDLSKLISEADLNVREFEKKKEDQDKLTDLITDQILEKVVSDECNVMADISDKKTPPPVAPKPRRTPEPAPENKEDQGHALMNGHLSPPESDSGQNSPLQKKIEMSNKVVDSLLDDALTKMLKISKKKRNENNNLKVTQNLLDLPISPTKELMEVLSREEEEDEEEDLSNVPPRPSSPMPGSTPQNSQRKMLDNDINALFGNELDDDEMFSGLTPAKAPPPYPGTPDPKLEMQKLAEEVKIAVPHTSEQVRRIVASAVEIHFEHLTNEESINGQEPPDSYFTEEELKDEGLESSSRRVYKKLLFDLTGELMKEIYKDEQKEEPPPWRKPKQRRQKYFRGASPPREVDSLTPIVQEAVIDMLGLNGSRKLDRNKWNIRKKKDHVDNILVQELREEEPEWVNYDDDEVAVKMQLTDNIFETLLTDTVQVMSKIYQKRRATVHN